MSDEGQGTSQGGVFKYVAIGVALVYVIASLYLMFDMRGRIGTLEQKQVAAETAQKDLGQKLSATNTTVRTSVEALGSKVGMTQEELAKRTAELRRQQAAAEQRLSAEQQQTKQVVSQVSGEVAGVKTDLGGAKSDITATKTDLEATKAKLERAIGDLGVQSGLIARTHEELDVLKHRGDRNYFEFTLKKNASPQPYSTVSLQLKKTDAKKGRFTMNVLADDRTIEKKDRTMNEPLQFYTGRDRGLFEVVVYKMDKDTVTGYLSTPKTQ
jgi:ribosomal protein L29